MQESEIIAEIPKPSEELSEQQLTLVDERERAANNANHTSRDEAFVNIFIFPLRLSQI